MSRPAPNPMSDEKRDEIIARYNRGEHIVPLMSDCKITPDTLYRVLRSSGVKLRATPRKKGLTAKDTESLAAIVANLREENARLRLCISDQEGMRAEIADLSETIAVMARKLHREGD